MSAPNRKKKGDTLYSKHESTYLLEDKKRRMFPHQVYSTPN